jgi:hydroxycarboxylate dehydrogenase B
MAISPQLRARLDADRERQLHPATDLHALGLELFTAVGVMTDEATHVMDHLIESSLMGLDSHGIMRLPDYVNAVRAGRIKPGAPQTIVKETPVSALIDCGWNFGQVSALRMTDIAIDKAARNGIACVVSQNGMHIGRVGAYPQRAAERGFVAFGVVNGPLSSQRVRAFGGTQPRFSTNPIAFAAPTGGDPLLLDMATCAMPEGKVRLTMQHGKRLPPDVLVDPSGVPTDDPALLYAKPPGMLLPLGGTLFGYKGMGLAMMVEILGGSLGGVSSTQPATYHNGFMLFVIDPDVFCGRDQLRETVAELCAHVTGVPPAPGHDSVQIPGAPEFRSKRERAATGIPVADETWRLIVEAA